MAAAKAGPSAAPESALALWAASTGTCTIRSALRLGVGHRQVHLGVVERSREFSSLLVPPTRVTKGASLRIWSSVPATMSPQIGTPGPVAGADPVVAEGFACPARPRWRQRQKPGPYHLGHPPRGPRCHLGYPPLHPARTRVRVLWRFGASPKARQQAGGSGMDRKSLAREIGTCSYYYR